MKIELKKDQRLFFTSDTHYGHSNICSATTKWEGASNMTREFDSLDHMNTTIINNINNTVGEDDILIHLGDHSFGGFDRIQEFRDRILCKNIHLVLGNHDDHISRNKENVQRLFSSVQDYLKLDIRRPINKATVEKFSFVCMHFPIISWDNMNQGVMHLFGHVHLPPHLRVMEGRAMDVGVDGNGLEPISLDEVVKILKDRPVRKSSLPSDHHERRI
jgi:calcineurin-like phosphoesterase family protein